MTSWFLKQRLDCGGFDRIPLLQMAPPAAQEEFESHTQENPSDTKQLHIFRVGTGMEEQTAPGDGSDTSRHKQRDSAPIQLCETLSRTVSMHRKPQGPSLLLAINFRSKS